MKFCKHIALWALLGCGDSSADQAKAAPNDSGQSKASAFDAGANAAEGADAEMSATGAQHDAGAHVGEPLDDAGDLVLRVTEAVRAYDRLVAENCECLVQQGAFASMGECLAPSASGPDWVPCATTFLKAHGSPSVSGLAQCLADDLDRRADCVSATACDAPERADCEGGAAGIALCGSGDPQLLVGLLQACPDLGLLSRL